MTSALVALPSADPPPAPGMLLREILAGKWVISCDAAGDTNRRYVAVRSPAEQQGQALSPRERDVLLRVLGGDANKVIAHELGLSSSSVTTLLRRARQKLCERVPEDLLRALLMSSPGSHHGQSSTSAAPLTKPAP